MIVDKFVETVVLCETTEFSCRFLDIQFWTDLGTVKIITVDGKESIVFVGALVHKSTCCRGVFLHVEALTLAKNRIDTQADRGKGLL
jgi:uncharacterized protein YjfI (DUF2170 family)